MRTAKGRIPIPVLVSIVLLLCPGVSVQPCWSGQEWSPGGLSELEFPRAASIPRTPIHAEVLDTGLAQVAAGDHHGLGREARLFLDWSRGKTGLSMAPSGSGFGVSDAAGGSARVSRELGLVLSHLNQFFEMPPSSSVTREELAQAFLSPDGVARVSALFEDAVRSMVRAPRGWIVPETGGEAVLQSDGIRFHPVPDATRKVLPRLAELLSEPDLLQSRVDEIRGLYRLYPKEMADVDDSGNLKSSLDKMPERGDRGVRVLRMALETALDNSSDSWILDPAAQIAVIAEDEWQGRHAGSWHTHTPIFAPEGWKPAGPPSGPDMENARRSGQFLTISFHPEGFDLYDLSGLAGRPDVDASRIVKTSYRSPGWKEHFRARHASLFVK